MGYKKEYSPTQRSHHSENSDSYGIRQVLANWILTVEMPTDVVAFVVSIVVIFITWKVVRLTVRAVMAIVWPMILFTLLLIGWLVVRDLNTCTQQDSFYECTTDYVGGRLQGLTSMAQSMVRKFSGILMAAYEK